MAQVNSSIPDTFKGWAKARVAEGRYSSTSDDLHDLVRRETASNEAELRAAAGRDLDGVLSALTFCWTAPGPNSAVAISRVQTQDHDDVR